jgi:hypothetical protein
MCGGSSASPLMSAPFRMAAPSLVRTLSLSWGANFPSCIGVECRSYLGVPSMNLACAGSAECGVDLPGDQWLTLDDQD